MKMIRKALKGEKGFTLIELLVVVAIIGILVAIAIPQFASYKKQANDSAAEADLRNLALAMESYFVSADDYTNATTAVLASTYGWKQTTKVTTTLGAKTASAWVATSLHASGLSTFTWDSAAGGMQ